MSRISEIRALVHNGLYYLTEHADDEAMQDGFDIYDVESGILTGKIRKTWPKEQKFEIIGKSLDGRAIDLSVALRKAARSASSLFMKINRNKNPMETTNFWQDETCEYCEGRIVEKRVTLYRKVKGEYVLIERPCGVCMNAARAILPQTC